MISRYWERRRVGRAFGILAGGKNGEVDGETKEQTSIVLQERIAEVNGVVGVVRTVVAC
jgi:hypothetical protein